MRRRYRAWQVARRRVGVPWGGHLYDVQLGSREDRMIQARLTAHAAYARIGCTLSIALRASAKAAAEQFAAVGQALRPR